MNAVLPISMLALLGGLSPVGSAGAAERAAVNRRTGLFETPVSDLRKAAERGDRAELTRTAGRLGPARLGKALADGDRRVVLAALEGIPLISPGLLLLDQIPPLAVSADPAIRDGALRTIAALLAGDSDRMAEWEVPAECVRAACQTLAAAASSESEKLANRMLALQGLAEAGALCAGSLKPALLLSSREPDIRRAAVLVMPADNTSNDALLAAARDHDGRVAAAAGARLCAQRTKSRALPGQASLRQLVLAEGAATEDVIEMLPCLMASKAPEDQKVLETLRESGASVVREAINAEAEKRPRP